MASVSTNASDTAPNSRIAIERHRRGNRWMHWINFPLLTVMIWSGLRIYWADLRDPYVFGIGGWEIYEFFPDEINEALGLERRLARGMAFHFSFAWLFVVNGAAFGLYLWRTGGWRNFVPTRADLRTIPAVLLHEVGIRKQPPPQGKYNGVQQLSYGAILVMGVLVVVSGFAIYKPTQLALLTTLMGGYEGARFIHFATTIGFIAFFVIHILQVARAGLSGLLSMITGYELLPPTEPPARHGYAEQRFNARLRDMVTAIVFAGTVVLALSALDSDPNPGWLRRIALGAVLITLVRDAALVAGRGTTPGKEALGLRVVRMGTTTAPGLKHAVVRTAPWLPLLLVFSGSRPLVITGAVTAGLVLVGSAVSVVRDDRRRSIMDRLAGTEVITTEHVPDPHLDHEQTEDLEVAQ